MKAKRKQSFHPRSSRFQNLFLAGLFLFLVAGIGGVLLVNNIQLYRKTQELRSKTEELRSQKEALEAQKAELETNITQGQQPEYQEKILREKGLYQKPGEQVITVVPEEPKPEAQGKPSKVWWDPRTWFSRE
ncbi:MAG: septum formation initiator family protein [Parcubacteria group bacterium]|nr:septum formation initiator family protein [Parcubacteria group bacterium]